MNSFLSSQNCSISLDLDIMFFVSWCQFSSYLNNVCHSFPLNSCNVQCSVMRKTIKIFTFLTPIMSGAVWYPLPLLEPLWAPRLLSMETIRAANGNRICLCEFSALLQWGIQPGIHYVKQCTVFWSKNKWCNNFRLNNYY